MKNKKISGKTFFIILLLVSIGILTAIGTYAYFAWSSTGDNKDATVSVTSVNGLGQCNKATDNEKILWPVSTRNNGRIVTVSTKQTLSEYAFVTWELTINSINKLGTEGDGLKHRTFRYELVNTTTGVSYGNGSFEGVQEGDTITLSNSSETLAYNTNYTFTLYLWIDGAMGTNPMDMTDQTYEFELVCEMTGSPLDTGSYLIAQPYTLNQSNIPVRTVNNVLGKSIDPASFESITTVNSSTVPNGVPESQVWDVSNHQNTVVKAWYVDADSDGLYELYIGQDGGVVANPDCNRLFSGFSNVSSIDLTYFDTSNVTTMIYMFANCTNLTSIIMPNIDTSKVTNMYGLFANCTSLSSINLNNFNTSYVTNMAGIFYNCSNLTSLNLSSFNTSKATDMSGMFYDCSHLTSLNLSNFNTSSVEDMHLMFRGCSGLTSLDLSSFDTSNVIYMSSMFSGCSDLTSLNLNSFNTSDVTDMTNMFYNCESITELDLSNFDTSSVEIISNMFSGCSLLQRIYVSNLWSLESNTEPSDETVFFECTNLVGGNGTTYTIDRQYIGYAVIDNPPNSPGLFTYKAHN